MTTEPLVALRDLRDVLRNPTPDIDSFIFLLSSTLQDLHLHPTSNAPKAIPRDALTAINRLLPALQIQLLASAVPIFHAELDESSRQLLQTFFVPPKEPSATTLPLRRAIASTSYITLTTLISASKPSITPLPPQSRSFVLSTLETLTHCYGIDELYWNVWSSSLSAKERGEGKIHGAKELRWEEDVRAIVGVSSKVANAVGKWTSEGWECDVPDSLVPRCVELQKTGCSMTRLGSTSTA